jgi:alpha-D-ribose 1-methylphosphonate 5-triphosphate synthase subunit PhnH
MSVAAALAPGLADPVHDSQRVFRAVLDAMSRPGSIVSVALAPLGPSPLSLAATALLLTLADRDTPVWLGADIDTPALRDFLRFHAGCPIVAEVANAAFAMASARHLPPLDGLNIGTDAYPDRAATLIVDVPALDDGLATLWRGPGIESAQPVAIAGIDAGFWPAWSLNHALYPCGVDIVFTAGNRLCALPRSVAVEC